MNMDSVDFFHLGPGDTVLAYVRKIIRDNRDVFYSYRLPWDGTRLKEMGQGNTLEKIMGEVASALEEKYPGLVCLTGDSVTLVYGHGDHVSDSEQLQDSAIIYRSAEIC